MENRPPVYAKKLDRLKQADQLRTFKEIDRRNGRTIIYKGRPCLNLSSNDYLGLATDTDLCRKFYASAPLGESYLSREGDLINSYGLSASSSRLLTGNSHLYETLEKGLCQWYGAEAALVFNSGYHANLGMIPALAGKGDLILSDSLNHASIIDGIRLSKAENRIFPHNDMDALAALLEKERHRFETVLIITESIFSMDGDRADITALVELKTRFNALLYVDEAHSSGVFGAEGQGLCYEVGLHHRVDILLGTMGKAMASHGAYAITTALIKHFLINTARSLIFSTALPPATVNWNLFLLRQMGEFKHRRKQLKKVSKKFRQALKALDIPVIGDSHIIPVITRTNRKTVLLSEKLIEKGFLAFHIRPPSVPENSARIRFSLTSDIRFEEICDIPELIRSHIDNPAHSQEKSP